MTQQYHAYCKINVPAYVCLPTVYIERKVCRSDAGVNLQVEHTASSMSVFHERVNSLFWLCISYTRKEQRLWLGGKLMLDVALAESRKHRPSIISNN